MKYTILTLICSLLYTFNLQAQDSTLYYSAEIQGAVGGKNMPFWLHSNQFGLLPEEGPFVNAQLGFYKKYNSHNPRFFQWSAGIAGVATVKKSSDFFLSDAYIAGKAGPVEISIGQRREFNGLGDSLLTSGFFSLSGNSRPYPRIRIGTTSFVNLIPGNDLLAFNFSYSDGILGGAKVIYGNTNYIPELYLHHKALYLRLGGPSHKLSFFGGFNHQAMWGGEEKIFSGGLKTWTAYEYVVIGKPWADSRVGNHFGTIDFAAQWNGRKWNVFLYRQSIYEDGSLSNLSNVADGLNGLRFKRVKSEKNGNQLKLNTLLLEYVYTKSQGGSIFDFATGTFGNDDYYNHYVYAQGWSYKGRGLGNPLIGSQHLNRDEIPFSYKDFTVNNRISGIHLGSELSWNKSNILVKGTFTRNFGTYNKEFISPLSQTSLLVRIEHPIPVWNKSLLSISLATDFGKLYTTNSAAMISFKKAGFLNK